jgi:DNA-directed RNA polymerase subunit L
LEIESFEENENILKMTVLGEGHTFMNLLRYYLTSSDEIEYAGYTMRHPLETRSDLFIKTKEGTAKDALLASLQVIQDHIEEFEQKFKATFE